MQAKPRIKEPTANEAPVSERFKEVLNASEKTAPAVLRKNA
jgi:hypothetical protein